MRFCRFGSLCYKDAYGSIGSLYFASGVFSDLFSSFLKDSVALQDSFNL